MSDEKFIWSLNEDLALAFRALVQTLSNLGAGQEDDFSRIRRLRIDHLHQQLHHTLILVRQVQALGGVPTTQVPPVHASDNAEHAITEELALEHLRLVRYRTRIRQARELGMGEAAAALEPLASDAQRQVDTLAAFLHR